MKAELALKLTNALTQTCHPRLDFRTEEAREYSSRLRPYFQKVIKKGQRVLDLGCGTGKHTFELERAGAIAFGIDCSEDAIQYARKIASDINSNAEFHIGTFENIPFPSDSFEAVLFPQNIVECSYEEMERIVLQLQSILCLGGKLFLEMQDGLEKAKHTSIPEVDNLSGTQERKICIPGKGAFQYNTVFWTIAFARFVIGKHLRYIDTERISKKNFMLTFEKCNPRSRPI